jgi:hypothetical protein
MNFNAPPFPMWVREAIK